MAWLPRLSKRPRAGSGAPGKRKRRSRARRCLIDLLFGRSPKEASPDAVAQATEWLDDVAADLDRGLDDGKKKSDRDLS